MPSLGLHHLSWKGPCKGQDNQDPAGHDGQREVEEAEFVCSGEEEAGRVFNVVFNYKNVRAELERKLVELREMARNCCLEGSGSG